MFDVLPELTAYIRGITPKKKSEHKNDFSWLITLNGLIDEALHTRYRITNLPDTCDERLTMLSLLWRSSVIFVEKDGALLSLPGSESGQPTIYGRYTSGHTESLNGLFNEWVHLYIGGEDETGFVAEIAGSSVTEFALKHDGVCVHENWTRFPFIYYCLYYAEAISDTLRTLDVARKHIKNPWVVTAEESVIDTVKKYFKNVDDNDEIILSSGVFPVDKISVLPLESTPESIRAATSLVQWYEARFHELCTLASNTAVDKKGENLIQGELDVSEDFAKSRSDALLDVLNTELDLANKHFGTHMKAEVTHAKDVPGDGDNLRGLAVPNDDTTGIEGDNT